MSSNHNDQATKSSDNLKPVSCPHCHTTTSPALFCDSCGKILPIAHVMSNDYFAWFGMKEGFRVPISALESKLIEYLNLLHPDRFANATAIEKQIATENTALYNKAFAVLSSPAERAHYILMRHGYNIDDAVGHDPSNTHTHSNNVLFLEAFMWRERLENAKTITDCQRLVEEFQYLAHELIHAIGEHLEEEDHEHAYRRCIKLRFVLRFQQEIIEKINSLL